METILIFVDLQADSFSSENSSFFPMQPNFWLVGDTFVATSLLI